MKALFCFLIFIHSLATEAQDFKCRKLNPKDYAYKLMRTERGMKDCFLKNNLSPEPETWGIEFILDRVKEKCSYKDENGERKCRPKFDFTDGSLLIIRFDDGFALVHVRHCSEPNRFFGIFKDTPGAVYGSIGILANYFVECQPR